jgi:hypothetical protein
MKTKNELIKMLQNGEIKEFNQYRKDNPNEVINLYCADLSSADLRSANLSFANLRSADLSSADLRSANLSFANLSSADLSFANFRGTDLRYANLCGTDLRYANLCDADLRDADLRGADLRDADLRDADLRDADLDFASLHLSCKSLRFKSDEKQRVQIAFHFASLIANCENATNEEKEIYENILSYVNKFHRPDVKRLTELNQSK